MYNTDLGNIKALKNIAERNLNNYNGNDEEALKELNKNYNGYSKLLTLYSELTGVILSTFKKQFALARKGFIICGRYCYKYATGKTDTDNANTDTNSVGESLMMNAISESSDMYIADMLGY